MRHKPHFCRQANLPKWWIKADYKHKISLKWGEKPHFRLIFGRDDRSRTCLNLLPKQAGNRYPTSRYSVFAVKSVSGQICGQKFFAGYEGGENARKREKNGDFASFRRSACEAVTRSQTTRATNCATSRFCFLIGSAGVLSVFLSAQSLVWKKAPPGVQMSARTPRLQTVLADLYARAFARTVRCFSLFLG